MENETVAVQLTPDDLRRFSNYLTQWNRLMLFLGCFALAFLWRWVNGGSVYPKHDILGLKWSTISIFVGVGLLIFFRWKRGRASFWRQDMPGALLLNHYRIQSDGLACENERGQTLHRWPAFLRLIETEQYFYLMLARRLGHVFPKRCFASSDAAADFSLCVRQHMKKAELAAQANPAV